MKDIIINQPNLQTLQQKLASRFLSLMSWLLWLYFLLPLFTLGGWLLGIKSWSDEIRWFGGYKTLLELLQMYGAIIFLIVVLWLSWTFFLSWIHASIKPQTKLPVDNVELAEKFNVTLDALIQARDANKITVHFDEHAQIIAMNYAKADSAASDG